MEVSIHWEAFRPCKFWLIGRLHHEHLALEYKIGLLHIKLNTDACFGSQISHSFGSQTSHIVSYICMSAYYNCHWKVYFKMAMLNIDVFSYDTSETVTEFVDSVFKFLQTHDTNSTEFYDILEIKNEIVFVIRCFVLIIHSLVTKESKYTIRKKSWR